MFIYKQIVLSYEHLVYSNKFKKIVMSVFSFVMIPGGWEWIVIGIAVALLFGGKQLPKLGKAAGKTVKEFRNISSSFKDGVEDIKTEVNKTK